MTKPSTNSIANWYGINRLLAKSIALQLGKLSWVGVPFMGGAPELQFIKARTCVANDLHRHVINLARVIQDETLCKALHDLINRTVYHEDALAMAQERCRLMESDYAVERPAEYAGLFAAEPAPRTARRDYTPNLLWAYEYFLCTWMTRGGKSGTTNEFKQGMSFRWNAGGGDSCGRFRSAAESLDAWQQILRPWTFLACDAFAFLDECNDQAGHGIYCDAPWPAQGDRYRHRFDEAMQRRLARKLATFTQTRVVVRFGDCALIRGLYRGWTVVEQSSRDQANADLPELLLVNGPAYGGGET
jgi:hypothetical protein